MNIHKIVCGRKNQKKYFKSQSKTLLLILLVAMTYSFFGKDSEPNQSITPKSKESALSKAKIKLGELLNSNPKKEVFEIDLKSVGPEEYDFLWNFLIAPTVPAFNYKTLDGVDIMVHADLREEVVSKRLKRGYLSNGKYLVLKDNELLREGSLSSMFAKIIFLALGLPFLLGFYFYKLRFRKFDRMMDTREKIFIESFKFDDLTKLEVVEAKVNKNKLGFAKIDGNRIIFNSGLLSLSNNKNVYFNIEVSKKLFPCSGRYLSVEGEGFFIPESFIKDILKKRSQVPVNS